MNVVTSICSMAYTSCGIFFVSLPTFAFPLSFPTICSAVSWSRSSSVCASFTARSEMSPNGCWVAAATFFFGFFLEIVATSFELKTITISHNHLNIEAVTSSIVKVARKMTTFNPPPPPKIQCAVVLTTFNPQRG